MSVKLFCRPEVRDVDCSGTVARKTRISEFARVGPQAMKKSVFEEGRGAIAVTGDSMFLSWICSLVRPRLIRFLIA
jgi:hypothetical protein